jgi:predicted ATP-dependent endonuclease of OLD family
MDNTILRVFVSAQAARGYTSVAERSDGLRTFIALLTFCALYAETRPVVLLVDEAENHLHYDAQADLVRVFSRQQAAAKVIYTTHSAGCLPHDLSGVRLVQPARDGTSTVTNSYWANGPGVSPLLIGMGASVLAFTPARRAVFAEGGADFILLPALMRDATGRDEVDFQILPGLAEVDIRDVSRLEMEAGSVAYLVDGDASGTRIRTKLRRGGVPDHRILSLGGLRSGLVIEDVLDTGVYVEAVNRVLRRSHGDGMSVAAHDVGNRDRPGQLRTLARRRGIDPPHKTAVAYEVLELRSEGRAILGSSHRRTIADLHRDLSALTRRAR